MTYTVTKAYRTQTRSWDFSLTSEDMRIARELDAQSTCAPTTDVAEGHFGFNYFFTNKQAATYFKLRTQ